MYCPPYVCLSGVAITKPPAAELLTYIYKANLENNKCLPKCFINLSISRCSMLLFIISVNEGILERS